MLIKQYDTSMIKGLTVGFAPYKAFVVRDATGYYGVDDIKEGIFEAGLLESSLPIEGMYIIAEAGISNNNGRVVAELSDPNEFEEELYLLFKYTEQEVKADYCEEHKCYKLDEECGCELDIHTLTNLRMEMLSIDKDDQKVIHDILETLEQVTKIGVVTKLEPTFTA